MCDEEQNCQPGNKGSAGNQDDGEIPPCFDGPSLSKNLDETSQKEKEIHEDKKVSEANTEAQGTSRHGAAGVEEALVADSENMKSCIASSAENEESKKEGDTSKAVTFAEDIEVYDLKVGTPITVSLDTPVHLIEPLIEPEEDSAWKLGAAAAESFTDSPSRDKEGFVSVDFVTPTLEDKTKETLPEDKQPATRPCVLSLNTDTPAILEDDTRGDKRHSGEFALTVEAADAKLQEEASVFPDQKFTVLAVDESELKVEVGTPEENGHIPCLTLKKDGTFEAEINFVKESSTGHSSLSNDSVYHDTIGPLENPAFLKTLHYSASQPLDDEEQFGLHSNIDLSSFAVGQNDPDLDGGWAWVVLAAAFVNLIILGASCLLSGVMMRSFVEVTKTDMTQASWIGSVYISIMCLSGPFVGSVTRKFGARPTICISGVIMFFGFIGASLSNSVPHFILSHSFIAGIGAGLAINPTFVIVGQYFNRLRGLACGLIATGGGAGVLAGGALISQLLSSFDLHGTYLIWAAISFNVTAMGMLMRPSPEEKLRLAEKELMVEEPTRFHTSSQHELISGHNSLMSGLNSMYSVTEQNSLHSGMDKLSLGRRSSGLHRHLSKHSSGDADVPLLKAILHKEMSRSSHSMSTNRSFHHRSQNQISSASMQKVHSPFGSNNLGPSSPVGSPVMTSPLTLGQSSRNTLSNHNVTSTNSLAASQMLSTSTLAAPTPSQVAPSSPTSTRGPTRGSFHRPRLMSSISQPTSHYTSLSLISQRLSFKDGMGHNRDLDNESVTSTLVNNLRPCDALTPRYALGSRSISALMGSLASFPTSLAIINDDLSRVDGIVPERQDHKTLKDYAVDVLDALRIIFNNKPFVVFLGTCFMWALGEAPIMIYLPSYAISRGTDPMQASALYTAMGVGSIAGRFLTGLTATDKNIGPMLLHIGCLGLAGLLVAFSPLIMSTVLEQMVFSSLLGVYTGSLVPLMSLTTIELLGISEMSVGFGFLCMAQGFGYLIGPPLAGVLFSSLGFNYSFVFAGLTLLCGCLLGMTIPLFIESEDEDNNSLNELEKMLQKISDSDSGSDVEEDEDHHLDVEEKEEDKKSCVEIVSSNGCAGENYRNTSEDTFVNISRTLDDGEDKLETIREIA